MTDDDLSMFAQLGSKVQRTVGVAGHLGIFFCRSFFIVAMLLKASCVCSALMASVAMFGVSLQARIEVEPFRIDDGSQCHTSVFAW